LISSDIEYEAACEEVEHLTDRLKRLLREPAATRKYLTVASVRKMLIRLHEELIAYEATRTTVAAPAEPNLPHLPPTNEGAS